LSSLFNVKKVAQLMEEHEYNNDIYGIEKIIQ